MLNDYAVDDLFFEFGVHLHVLVEIGVEIKLVLFHFGHLVTQF